MFSRLKNIILSRVEQEGQFLLFNILMSFLVSFFLAHLYSIFVPLVVFLRGYHIHHFYYGIVFLAAGGTIGTISDNKIIKRVMSCMLGLGIGLVVDELGLLLSCTTDGKICSYKFPDIFDIVIYITVVYVIFILFGHWIVFRLKNFLIFVANIFKKDRTNQN